MHINPESTQTSDSQIVHSFNYCMFIFMFVRFISVFKLRHTIMVFSASKYLVYSVKCNISYCYHFILNCIKSNEVNDSIKNVML